MKQLIAFFSVLFASCTLLGKEIPRFKKYDEITLSGGVGTMIREISRYTNHLHADPAGRHYSGSRFFIPLTVIVLILSFTISCAKVKQPFTQKAKLERQLSDIKNRLERADRISDRLIVKTIGEIKYENFSSPILLAVYASPGKPEKKILINGGIHGDEPAGSMFLMDFIEDLAEKKAVYKGIQFDIIPIVNPWGFSRNLRYNFNGKDINRDFADFETQEAAAIRDFIKKNRYDLMIDLHEDPSAEGVYLYQYGRDTQDTARKILELFREWGYPIETDVNMIILKTDDGLIDAPMWGLYYMKLTGQLSLSNYYRLNNSENVFTVETPVMTLYLDQRKKVQETAVLMFIDETAKMK